MVIKRFPPLSEADEHGLLALGGDLDTESLLLAYSSGIFPWPIRADLLAWFSPPSRAVLFLKHLHLPRSLQREMRKQRFEVRWNRDFRSVIEHCAHSPHRPGQRGTWIIPDLIPAYCALHSAGFAFSVECYLENRLVGGLYGVTMQSFVAGESMFYLEKNASKVALSALTERLLEAGIEWVDCQVLTPHLQRLGAIEISRDDYVILLGDALARRSDAELASVR